MAIIIANDGDKVVNTFADMNSLTAKFDGMEVKVLDSIGDVLTGGGEAGYFWSVSKNKWILAWKTSKDNLTFITESKVIADGKVTAIYPPQSALVWNCYITDSNGLIVADVTPTVITAEIDLGSLSYEGMTLSYTYGYGTIQAAVQVELGSLQAALDAILGV